MPAKIILDLIQLLAGTRNIRYIASEAAG